MIISIPDISIRKKLLLHGKTLSLPSHGLVLLQGKNGCGKTLLLNRLFELCREQLSCILIEQESGRILPDLSISENLLLSNNPAAESELTARLEPYGLSELIRHKTNELSGGECRIVQLLRGLYAPAALYLVDEPTNDLDFDAVNRLCALFREKKEKALLLIVSHDDRLEALADGRLLIQGGELHTEGCVREEPASTQEDAASNQKEPKAALIAPEPSANHTAALLPRIFPPARFVPLLVLVSLLFFLYTLILVSQVDGRLAEDIPANQVDFFLNVSSGGEQLYGALPLPFAYSLREDMSVKEYKLLLEELSASGATLRYCLHNIPDSVLYEAYPIEYYEPSRQTSLYLPAEYLSAAGQTGPARLDTGGLFMLPRAQAEKDLPAVPLDPVLYQNMADEILQQSDSLEPVFVTLILNEPYTLKDLLSSPDFITFADRGLWFRSELSITLYNMAELYTGRRMALVLLTAGVLLCALMEVALLRLWLLRKKGDIRILRNQSFDQKVLLRRILSVSLVGKTHGLIFLLSLSVGIWALITERTVLLPFIAAFAAVQLDLGLSSLFWLRRKTRHFLSWSCR